MDGCGGGRPTPVCEEQAGVRPLRWQYWVLECTSGEGLCQVCTWVYKRYVLSCLVLSRQTCLCKSVISCASLSGWTAAMNPWKEEAPWRRWRTSRGRGRDVRDDERPHEPLPHPQESRGERIDARMLHRRKQSFVGFKARSISNYAVPEPQMFVFIS